MNQIFIGMEKIIISETISPDENYAIVEDGVVKAVLNEETRKNGYMSFPEARAFLHSLVAARYKKARL